jgi:hypothetical protein
MSTPEDDLPVPLGQTFDYYIDIRHIASSNKISLDLSRHLPARAAAGPVAIIADRPLVLLSVIKKRWVKIIYEVERRYASTLDRAKKQHLKAELERLRAYRFSANSLKPAPVDILFLASTQLLPHTIYPTIYLTTPIEYERLSYVLSHLKPGGVLVIYSEAVDEAAVLKKLKTNDQTNTG